MLRMLGSRMFSNKIRPSITIKAPFVDSESIKDGVVGEWFVKVGDKVLENQSICELETDKLTIDIKAPQYGKILELLIKQHETVKLGEPLFIMEPRLSVRASTKE